MTDEAAGHLGPVSRVSLELAPRTAGALLLVAVGLWLLVRLWPVVLFAFLAGGTRVGVLGALLALPVAATVMMLVEELRVELPGERERPEDTSLREGDDRAEEEYGRRTHGVGAQQAAGIAAEISRDRRKAEARPPEPERRSGSAELAE